MTLFGQLVTGPPGSGKTTYCKGVCDFLRGFKREAVIVNLDPANDLLPYTCEVDVRELVDVESVMEHFKLGPNGGLLYCMEYLVENFDWLAEKLRACSGKYLLFDCPGQVELFTHYDTMKKLVERLTKELDVRLAMVHLVDSHYCSDASKFLSVMLVSLSTMIHIELPHINVLSKIDLIESMGELDFNLDFYTEVNNLEDFHHLLRNQPPRYKKFSNALVEVIRDFDMVTFATLNIMDKYSVYQLVRTVDQSNGYLYSGLEQLQYPMGGDYLQLAMGGSSLEGIRDVQERYFHPHSKDVADHETEALTGGPEACDCEVVVCEEERRGPVQSPSP